MTIFKKVSAFIENKPQSITLDIKQLEKLAELENVHFTMSIFDLISKKYNIDAIYLDDGFINLYVDKRISIPFVLIFIEGKCGKKSLPKRKHRKT